MACAARRATKVHEFVAHGAVVNCISIGKKSGKVVATAGDDKKINLWTIPRYNCVLRLHGHTTPIDTVKFHPNEDLLASGSNSGAVKLFDLEAARVLRTLNGHKASVQCIDFHPYGEFIASGSCDNSIKLWDSRRRSCINTYRGHEQKVNSIRFSPDGRWIVSGGDDGSIKLWDLAMGKMINQFNEHHAAVNDVEFHPNEYLLASGSEDGTVKFYDLETWTMISSTSGDSGQVHCTRFHPDGDVIMVGADDLMRIYAWEPTVSTFDRVVMGWGKVEDLMVGKEAIVAASKSVTNVCVYVLDTNKVQPFAGSATFIDEAPMKTTSFRRSSPLSSNPRRSFNTKTRGKLDVAYKRDMNSSEASDNSYDSYEPSSTDDVCIMEPSSYNEIFHPSKELSRSPPRDSYPVMSNSGSGLFRLPPIKDAAPNATPTSTTPSTTTTAAAAAAAGSTTTTTAAPQPPLGPSRSPPRVDPVISRNLQSSECLKSITTGNRLAVSSTATSTTAMNNFNNTINTNNLNNHSHNNNNNNHHNHNLNHSHSHSHNNNNNRHSNTYSTLSSSNMRSSYSMGNIKETSQHHHGSLSSSSSTLSSVSDNNRKTGTANSTSSGDLSPILLASEPSTPVKSQNFLPRRTAEKAPSEQSLVSIVKPVMSVKAAAVVHPEVVSNIPPPTVCQPEKQGYNVESFNDNGVCDGGVGGGGGGGVGGGGIGGGLNFDDFLPAHVQSLSRGPRSTIPVSETEAVEKISSGHNGMMLAMMHRLNGLRQIHARWHPKDPRAAVEIALNLRDASVLVDLLNVLVLRSAIWNLDLCHQLLPAMYELIQSKYEPQMATAISGIKVVLKNFGSVIKETVAGPRSVGVDLSREERYGKCSGCHESLLKIRSFLLRRQTMQGKVGSQFRDLLAVMEMLD